MRILPFRRPAVQDAPSVASDWSQQELADFYRAHRLLMQNGVSIGIDRGQGDDGDPWMVFFDTASQDVFLHVARIDGRCVLICETLGIRLTRDSIDSLVTAFEGEVRQMLSVRQDRASNVLLHPAARIIMSISTVFLLFKLENGGTAQAKTIAADAAVLDAARKQDLSVAARVHQAIGRLLDLADTPAAAAAIAGAILTLELTRSQAADDAHQAMPAVETVHAPEAALLLADLHAVQLIETAAAGAAGEAAAQNSAAPTIVVNASAVDLDARVEIAVKVKAPASAQTSPEHEPMPPADIVQAEVEAKHPGEAANVVSGAKSSSAPTVDVAQAATLEPAVTTSLAALVIKPLLTEDQVQLAVASDLVVTDLIAPAEPAVATTAISLLGDISAADFDILDVSVGLLRETAISGEKLTDTIVDFMMRFGSYEVEIVEGRVLIEQHDAAWLSTDLVGIWTNVMSDGSDISVVGHLDLISDLTASFV